MSQAEKSEVKTKITEIVTTKLARVILGRHTKINLSVSRIWQENPITYYQTVKKDKNTILTTIQYSQQYSTHNNTVLCISYHDVI